MIDEIEAQSAHYCPKCKIHYGCDNLSTCRLNVLAICGSCRFYND